MALQNKIALVTGGSSGIGLATVNELLNSGIKGITVADIQESLDIRSLREKNSHATILYAKTDVSSEHQVREAFQLTLKKLHGLDIVVHSAGVFDDRDWRRQVEINVNGTIIVNLMSLETMGKDKGGKGGVLINVSSEAAFVPFGVMPMYSATKAAGLALARSFATDLFYKNTGVAVITMCPSATSTALTPRNTDRFMDRDIVLDVAKDFSTGEYFQRPESVGKCIIDAVLRPINGTIWLSKNDLPGQRVLLKAEYENTTKQ